MIKVFPTNKEGKIELTKDELKALLDEAYWDGYRANGHYIYSTPIATPWWYTGTPTITCNGSGMTINAEGLKSGVVTNTCEIEFGLCCGPD